MQRKIEKMVSRFRKGMENTVAFYQTIPVNVWENVVYSDGQQWRIKDILAHQAQAEDDIRELVRSILHGSDGVPAGFDLDSHNEERVEAMRKFEPEDLLNRFVAAREKTIQTLIGMNDAELEKRGRHPWLGETAVGDMLKLMTSHNRIHQRDIRKHLTER